MSFHVTFSPLPVKNWEIKEAILGVSIVTLADVRSTAELSMNTDKAVDIPDEARRIAANVRGL
jgi:hypothetical protein